MSFSHAPTVDELLSDRLVQAVMRADHVEPAELKALLGGVAGRISRRRESEGKALRFFATPRLEWRPSSADADSSAPAFPAPVANACSAEMCC